MRAGKEENSLNKLRLELSFWILEVVYEKRILSFWFRDVSFGLIQLVTGVEISY